jgi:signal transduction histidine kinase
VLHLTRARRFVGRLFAPLNPNDAPRIEQGLATARLFLAFSALVALHADLIQAGQSAALAHALFATYALYSVSLLLLIRVRPQSTHYLAFAIHAVDTVWPALMAFSTQGPRSSFLVFCVFAFAAAAYRWGLWETLLTAAVTVPLLLLEVPLTRWGLIADSALTPGDALMRAAYLVLLSALLGYLGQEQNRLQAETSELAHILATAQSADGLRATIRSISEELLRLFEARRALMVFRESRSGRVYLWEARSEGETGELQVLDSELKSSEVEVYLFPAPGHSWHLGRRWQRAPTFLALDPAGRRMRNATFSIPGAFLAAHECSCLMAVSVGWGNEWSGRLFLLDPDGDSRPAAELRFLQNLVRQLASIVYSALLASRLRSQAGAMERARVARELHDGIVQSLIAVEMHVQVLRHEATDGSAALAKELERLQQVLRNEVSNLREMMQRMKPLEIRPAELVDFIAGSVERFERDTGIGARFFSELDEAVSFPPRVCREVARIVQEALVNVRKHSAAHHVLIHLGRDNGSWKLVIDDDGRGFPFSGRLTQAELDRTRKGPMVIKERVRAIGGELTVESTPGRGARLEIFFPGTTYG